MRRKLIYVVLGITAFAVLGIIFGEKFLIDGVVGAMMAGLLWLFVIEPGRLKEKAKQEKANAQKQSLDSHV